MESLTTVANEFVNAGLGWYMVAALAIRAGADVALVLLTPRQDRAKVIVAKFRRRSDRKPRGG